MGSRTDSSGLKPARAVDSGVLANHIWSFAETSSLGPDVNSTFIQPFIGYTTPTAFTTTLERRPIRLNRMGFTESARF